MVPSPHLKSHCPVEAIIDDLARALDRKADHAARVREGAEFDHHEFGISDDRERALVCVAETSRVTSLRGAALQIVLNGDLAADMSAAMMSAGVHGYEMRDCGQLDRAAEAMTRSAYAAIAALGGELPSSILERFMSADGDTWAALGATDGLQRAP